MPTFDVKYSEVQTRVWFISIEAETAEEARQICADANDDIWSLVNHDSRAEWNSSSGADGEAVDTLESEIEVDDTPMAPYSELRIHATNIQYRHSQSKGR